MDDLPADKKHGSQRTGGDRQRSAHGQKGRAEHQIVPVIDAAGGAAAVMHPESLEGTEKEDADNVAHAVEPRKTHQKPQPQPALGIAEKDQGIAADPYQSHQGGAPVCMMDGGDSRGLAGGAMPPGKDLLAAQTLHAGGKEPYDHGDHQQAPHHRQGGAAEGPVQIREKLIRCGQRVKKQCAEGGGSGGKTPEGIVPGFGGMCHRAASFRTAGRRASSHWARSLYTVSRHVSKRISCRSWG